MEQEKTYTETELRNEIKKLVKTDLTFLKVVPFIVVFVSASLFAMMLLTGRTFKVTDTIIFGSVVFFYVLIGSFWRRAIKSVDAESDSLVDLAQKLKKCKKWNLIFNCSMPLALIFVLISNDMLDNKSYTWSWYYVVVILVFGILFIFNKMVFESSMKQKYDGLIAKLSLRGDKQTVEITG